MTLTDRDRKIVLLLVPIVVLAVYWLLLLTPKREEAAIAGEELAAQEQRRDAAQLQLDQLAGARTDFAADYATMVRLGKAVPESVDMPTLLVQLQAAAAGTGISFTSIATEEREPAAVAPAPPAPGTGDGTQPAAAGGAPAQSAPGGAAESAGDAVTDANAASTAAEQSGVDPADTATSTQANEGALPVGGGAVDPEAAAATGTSGVLGLDAVPINLTFTGDFFKLSAFFHELKRYVEADEEQIVVRGRLVVVEGISFASEPDTFPKLTAEVTATAYLAPRVEGVTAGATASGPLATTPAGDGTVAPDAGADTPPTATATR
jgi:Tfp pilus assembly protein PilO